MHGGVLEVFVNSFYKFVEACMCGKGNSLAYFLKKSITSQKQEMFVKDFSYYVVVFISDNGINMEYVEICLFQETSTIFMNFSKSMHLVP